MATLPIHDMTICGIENRFSSDIHSAKAQNFSQRVSKPDEPEFAEPDCQLKIHPPDSEVPEITESPCVSEPQSGDATAQAHPRLTLSYGHASQTMKRHLNVSLKYVSFIYQRYEELAKVTSAEMVEKDEQYLQVVMLKSSLLKALHVCTSFQAHCTREYPEVSFEFEDALASFDGTLATIYEGEDVSNSPHRGSVSYEDTDEVQSDPANETISISNAELERFAAIMKSLSAAVQTSREQETASKLREEKLVQEIEETQKLLADASVSRATRVPVRNGEVPSASCDLASQVRRLIDERDRLATQCRVAKQAAAASSRASTNTNEQILEAKCKDFQLRYESLSQKFVDLAHRRKPSVTATGRRKSARDQPAYQTATQKRSTYSNATPSEPSTSAASDTTEREVQQRHMDRNVREAKIGLFPMAPTLLKPVMVTPIQVPRLRSLSCERAEGSTWRSPLSSENQPSRNGSFEPSARVRAKSTPKLSPTSCLRSLPRREATRIAPRSMF